MHPYDAQPEIAAGQLQAVLELCGLALGAAEAHGIVCGHICRRLTGAPVEDLTRLIAGNAEMPDGIRRGLRERIAHLAQQVYHDLHTGRPDFELFVPDDDEAGLVQRAEALADWCRGFLLGLLRDPPLDLKTLPADAAEVVRDIGEIAQLDAGDGGEAEEWSYNEIFEYLRVGVQVIFEALHAEHHPRPDPGAPGAHKGMHS